MLIERTPDNRFCLGMKLYDLGNRAVEQVDLRTRVRPFFRKLSQRLGETMHLGVLQKTSVVYLDKADASRRVCSGSKTGSSNPVYCTAMGKAMLAFLPPEAAKNVIDHINFVRFTNKTLCSREDLMKSLERCGGVDTVSMMKKSKWVSVVLPRRSSMKIICPSLPSAFPGHRRVSRCRQFR